MQASSSSRGNTSFLSSSPKAQPLASATPLHFQQQPSILSSGSTDFSDLSSSHREQQQLFLLSHGCRHPSSTLKNIKIVFFLIQILQIYSLAPESRILYFLGYSIFTNARVGNIHWRIFTDTRVRNIIERL
jgi:hypothetical protein